MFGNGGFGGFGGGANWIWPLFLFALWGGNGFGGFGNNGGYGGRGGFGFLSNQINEDTGRQLVTLTWQYGKDGVLNVTLPPAATAPDYVVEVRF